MAPTNVNARKHQARVAGLLYLLMSVASVVTFSNIPTFTGVGSDVAAIADKIVASPLPYRIGILCDLAGQILSVLAVLSLYQLFQDVNTRLAVIMAALAFVSIPWSVANLFLAMAPLVLLSRADYLAVFDKGQLDALAMGFLNLRGYGIGAQMTLFGLVLVPFGLLAIRSGFIPRILGFLLILGSFPYLAISVTSLLFPAYGRALSPLMVLALGEILMILWLLIRGVKVEALEDSSTHLTTRRTS